MLSSISASGSAGYFSKGIMRWNAVKAVLPEFNQFVRLSSGSAPKVNAIIGWGAKPTSKTARAYAEQHQLPYVAIEDGFLRSFGLGVEKDQPQSLVVDTMGIYYDAHRPSELEHTILHHSFSTEEIERARRCMDRIRHHHLSKYNSSPDRLPKGLKDGQRYVLVVDQTRDDASVTLGMGSEERFKQMLKEALEANPDAQLLIKVHPDVASGHRRGYLSEATLPEGCQRISESLNPWPLLERVDTVHVMTSQMGFEALMAGCKVICHGIPFYSGWGLTEDRQHCERRQVSRSVEEVFAAAYQCYSRYYNPYTKQPCSLEDTINLLADQKRQSERTAGNWVVYGLSRWKQGFIHQFLGAKANTRYVNAHSRWKKAASNAAPQADEKVLIWGYHHHKLPKGVTEESCPSIYHMEDGFIRSVGLGADLVRPCSLVLDSRGIYYDPSRPSDLEYLLQHEHFSDDLLIRAKQLRKQLVDLKLSKYNVGQSSSINLPSDKTILLVPGQVESDASIRHGTRSVSTNAELLRRVRAKNPGAFILFKEHPDVTSGGRLGALSPEDRSLYDLDVTGLDIVELFNHVDVIHTMSSLTGFEALLRGIPVHTWGSPFYAGWGLTHQEEALSESLQKRRSRHLTLDELVAGTLLLYPTYVDSRSGDLCNAETVVEVLKKGKEHNQTLPFKVQTYRLYRTLFEGRY